MSYFPVVWLLVWLIRLVYRSVRARKYGEVAARPSVPPGGQFGAANLAVFGVMLLFAPLGSLVVALVLVHPLPESLQGLVGIVVWASSCVGLFAFPHWLAWRVLGPWGFASLGRWVLPLALYGSVASRRGARDLYAARFGGRDPSASEPSLWAIAALALHAEAVGLPDRADDLLRLLGDRPRGRWKSGRPVNVAAEALAWSALRGGERERAAERAAVGRGRAIWLVRRLAAVELGRPVSPLALLWFWGLAPERRRNLTAVRAALQKSTARPESPAAGEPGVLAFQPRLPSPRAVGPARAHLALLAHVSAGGTVRTQEVERLAEAWSAALDAEPASAGLLRRALELGGQEISELPAALRSALLDELVLLAEAAEGEWTAPGETLAGSLGRRALETSFNAVEEEIDALDQTAEGADSRPMAEPLEELVRWVDLRAKVERLERKGGLAALQTSWHGGLRYTACNWGVFLVRQRGAAASWPAYYMHLWSADLATQVGDEEIARLSRENAELTQARLA